MARFMIVALAASVILAAAAGPTSAARFLPLPEGRANIDSLVSKPVSGFVIEDWNIADLQGFPMMAGDLATMSKISTL